MNHGHQFDLDFQATIRRESTVALVRRRDYEAILWRHTAVKREIARRGRARLPHALSLATALRAVRRAGK